MGEFDEAMKNLQASAERKSQEEQQRKRDQARQEAEAVSQRQQLVADYASLISEFCEKANALGEKALTAQYPERSTLFVWPHYVEVELFCDARYIRKAMKDNRRRGHLANPYHTIFGRESQVKEAVAENIRQRPRLKMWIFQSNNEDDMGAYILHVPLASSHAQVRQLTQEVINQAAVRELHGSHSWYWSPIPKLADEMLELLGILKERSRR